MATPCRSNTGAFYKSELGVFGCPRIWEFSDQGFIYGGQSGALRTYTGGKVGLVDTVAESPWTILKVRPSLRLDFENDGLCPLRHLDGRGGNYNTQIATAQTTINLPIAATLQIKITGMAETEDPQEPEFLVFERMELYIDDMETPVATGHSPGGGLGCEGGMAPVVVEPSGTITVNLSAGAHILYIWASTVDYAYHWRGSAPMATDGTFYQFDISIVEES